MLSIGNKKYRNIQEQVAWLTSVIENGDIIKYSVELNASSGTLTEEQKEILEEDVAFILYDGKIYVKSEIEDNLIKFAEASEIINNTTNYILKNDYFEVNLEDLSYQLTSNSLYILSEGQINDKLIQTEDGKKFAIVACVLRNIGGTWQQIGGQHASINVASIEQTTYDIIVNYNFTCKNVVSFVACPDEEFASLGYTMGASGQITNAVINVFRMVDCDGYFSWNGSSFTTSGRISSVSINNLTGEITITHDDTQTALARSVAVRDGKYLAYVKQANATQDIIVLTDYSGNAVLTPDADFKVYWGAYGKVTISSSNANNSGNIWCFGIMEVE